MFRRRRDLNGKRAIVTGASSGIGRALAVALAKRGCTVLTAARSEDKLKHLQTEIAEAGGACDVSVTDVTDPDSRTRLIEQARQRLGGLDLLVNAAGVGAFGHFVDLGPEILRRIFEVNFFALAETCRAAIPLLAEGDDAVIVNIGSMTGRRGVPAWTDYSASKFAVSGFSEALRAELVRFGIELTLAIPGVTKSDLGRNLLMDKGRMPPSFDAGLPAAAVAEAIVRGVERRKHEVWIERNARMMLWANWLWPRFVDRMTARVVRKLYKDEIAARQKRGAPA